MNRFVTHVISGQLVAETWVRSQGSSSGLFFLWKGDTRTGFPASTRSFS